MPRSITEAILDSAQGRVFVLTGRNTDSGHDAVLFGVFGSEGSAEHLRDQLRAARTPYQLAITPIIKDVGVPAEIDYAP